MKKSEKNSYAVLFTSIPEVPSLKRIALLKQFVTTGFGSDIDVVEHAFFENDPDLVALVIVSAASEKIVADVLKVSTSILATTIVPASLKYEGKKSESSHLILGFQYPVHSNYEAAAQSNEVKIQSLWELPTDSHYPSLCWLTSTDGYYANMAVRDLYAPHEARYAMPISPTRYLEKLTSGKPETIQESNSTQLTTETPGLIVNKGSSRFYYASADNNKMRYDNLLKSRVAIDPGRTEQADHNVYVWDSLEGIYSYDVSYRLYPLPDKRKRRYNIPSNAAPPRFSTLVAPGVTIGIDASEHKDVFEINELTSWMDELFKSSKFDEDWPEDGYTGEKREAYNFILSVLKEEGIDTEPKDGTIKPGDISAIEYEQSEKFTEEIFKEVRSHLIRECTDFEHAKDWYGFNGIFNIIHLTIQNGAQNSLTQAASLMQIPEEKTIMELVLDFIFGTLTTAISNIPTIGSFISAVMKFNYSIAKLAIGSGNASQPFEATIAQMADVLNKYLDAVVNANAKQLYMLNNNYGKLKEFAKGVKNKKVTASKFGFNTNGDTNNPSPSFVTATSKAWRVVFYKSLFKVRHAPLCQMTSDYLDANPINPFNPAERKYDFNYYVHMSSYNSDKVLVEWILLLQCWTRAPKQVLQDLFDNENINLDPLEFYLGLNGWPEVIPYREGGYKSESYIEAIFP